MPISLKDPLGGDPLGGDPFLDRGDRRRRRPPPQVRSMRLPTMKPPLTERQKLNEFLDAVAPVPEELTTEQRSELLSSIGSMSVGGLAAVGNFLDIPGSFVRDAVSGENPFDQLLPWNWFTHEGRMTGRDMLTKWGWTDKNDPDAWEWSDFAGFLAEVGLDPLTYFSFGALPLAGKGIGGLSKIGRATQKAGILGDLPGVAARKSGIDPKRFIGRHEARGMVTIKDILEDPELVTRIGRADLDKRVTEALMSEGIETVYDAANFIGLRDSAGRAIKDAPGVLGGGMRIGIPWTDIGKTFSPTGGRGSRLVDRFNRWIGEGWAGRRVAQAFDHGARGLSNKYGQLIARMATHFQDQNVVRLLEQSEVFASYQDRIRDILGGYLGDTTNAQTRAILGRESALTYDTKDISDIIRVEGASLKAGDTIEMPKTGQPAMVTGHTDESIIVRLYDRKLGQYRQATVPKWDKSGAWPEPSASNLKRIKAGTSGLEVDLVEQMMESFIRAVYEGGITRGKFTDVQRAIKDWGLQDVLGARAGIKGKRGIEEILAEGLRGTADELPKDLFSGILESSLVGEGKPLTGIKDVLDVIQNRMAAAGVNINRLSRLGYMPRDVVQPLSKKLTKEQRALGVELQPGGRETEDIFNLREGHFAGRTPALATLPQHTIQRMLNDVHIHQLRKPTADESRAGIEAMLRKDYAEPLARAGHLRKRGLNKYTREGDLLSELADELYKHAGDYGGFKGPMYKSDLWGGIQNYMNQMSTIEATHFAGLSVLGRVVRNVYRPDPKMHPIAEGVPLYEVLREAGHDIKPFDGGVPIKSARDGRKRAGSLHTLARMVGKNPLRMTDEEFTALAEIIVPQDIANQLKITRKITDPGPFQEAFVNLLDMATSSFKSNVTLPFLSFAMRNHISGQVVNVTSGNISSIGDLRDYIKSYMLARSMSRNPEKYLNLDEGVDLREIRNVDLVERKHLDDVAEVGKKESAFWGTSELDVAPGPGTKLFSGRWGEAKEAIAATPKPIHEILLPIAKEGAKVAADAIPIKGTATARTAHRAMLAAGSKLNKMVEWQNRVAMYLYLRKKGFGKDAAKLRVDDLQFDYSRLAGFEKSTMRRLVPFYAFTRKMAPLFAETLATRPGGSLSQLIRGQRLASQYVPGEEVILPEHIRQEAPVPTGGTFLEPKEEGAYGAITGQPFAHPDPISYLSGLPSLARGDISRFFRRGGLAAAGRVTPYLKGPIEWLTNQSLWQSGPGGSGRQLDEQNPAIAQTFANLLQGGGLFDEPLIPQTEKPGPAFGSSFLEHLAMNLPISRYLTTARTVLDPRKGALEKLVGLTTGIKTTTLSPYQQRKAMRDQIGYLAELGGYGGTFETPRIDRIQLVKDFRSGRISEREMKLRLNAQALLNKLSREAYKGSAGRKLERLSGLV